MGHRRGRAARAHRAHHDAPIARPVDLAASSAARRTEALQATSLTDGSRSSLQSGVVQVFAGAARRGRLARRPSGAVAALEANLGDSRFLPSRSPTARVPAVARHICSRDRACLLVLSGIRSADDPAASSLRKSRLAEQSVAYMAQLRRVPLASLERIRLQTEITPRSAPGMVTAVTTSVTGAW